MYYYWTILILSTISTAVITKLLLIKRQSYQYSILTLIKLRVRLLIVFLYVNLIFLVFQYFSIVFRLIVSCAGLLANFLGKLEEDLREFLVHLDYCLRLCLMKLCCGLWILVGCLFSSNYSEMHWKLPLIPRLLFIFILSLNFLEFETLSSFMIFCLSSEAS